jgi:phosphatidylserine decarboxylase
MAGRNRPLRKFMKILGLAPYGGDEFLIAALACGSGAYALSLAHPLLALIPVIPFGIVVWFFRDPDRSGPDDESILLSPADGTVTDIEELDEPEFIGGRARRIGIFLSPFNVHVNRVPCEGKVRYTKYKAGDFLPAYNPQAPTRNESVFLGLEMAKGTKLIVRQVTGVLARRIICEASNGEILKRGERYGMIKFGSRTELYVPAGAFEAWLVGIGDKVVGGQTPICKVRDVPIEMPDKEMRERAEMILHGAAMVGDAATETDLNRQDVKAPRTEGT